MARRRRGGGRPSLMCTASLSRSAPPIAGSTEVLTRRRGAPARAGVRRFGEATRACVARVQNREEVEEILLPCAAEDAARPALHARTTCPEGLALHARALVTANHAAGVAIRAAWPESWCSQW
mmetsp:Transcript_7695/g.24100  ORF Transcript_7695/g.24100 Transcript_7695/m.24100 type:complete len:123 (-) Transcript_7695:104-472(-)